MLPGGEEPKPILGRSLGLGQDRSHPRFHLLWNCKIGVTNRLDTIGFLSQEVAASRPAGGCRIRWRGRIPNNILFSCLDVCRVQRLGEECPYPNRKLLPRSSACFVLQGQNGGHGGISFAPRRFVTYLVGYSAWGWIHFENLFPGQEVAGFVRWGFRCLHSYDPSISQPRLPVLGWPREYFSNGCIH